MLTSFYLHKKRNEVCIKVRSTPTSLLFKALVTEHRTANLMDTSKGFEPNTSALANRAMKPFTSVNLLGSIVPMQDSTNKMNVHLNCHFELKAFI